MAPKNNWIGSLSDLITKWKIVIQVMLPFKLRPGLNGAPDSKPCPNRLLDACGVETLTVYPLASRN